MHAASHRVVMDNIGVELGIRSTLESVRRLKAVFQRFFCTPK